MERFHDRPFQDFVAHETHRLIPRNCHVLSAKNETVFGLNPLLAREEKRSSGARLIRRLEKRSQFLMGALITERYRRTEGKHE
jgi:hypothetical protein